MVCLHFYKLSLDYMFLCHYSYLLSYFLFISLLCCWRFRLVFINFLFQTFVYCCWRTLGLVIDFWFWKPTEAHVFNQQKLEKDWFPKNQHKDEIPKKGKIVNEWKERKKRPSNELTVWSRFPLRTDGLQTTWLCWLEKEKASVLPAAFNIGNALISFFYPRDRLWRKPTDR